MQLFKKLNPKIVALTALVVVVSVGVVRSQATGVGAKSFIGSGAAKALLPYYMIAP